MLLLLLYACAPYPEGLRATPDGDGPVVKVDWDAEPLPEIPFPNDLATVVDRHSPTGLRVNVPIAAKTHLEIESREKLNSLSGFGIYAPVTVAFESTLDLDNVYARHTSDWRTAGEHFDDDAFFMIDVTPGSPTYQQPVQLDVGHGRYPMDAARSDRYFPNDSRSTEPSVIFDTISEDVNGNGVLDWGEDTDNDGYLDVANVYPEGADHRDGLMSWYERVSNTLVMRPAKPLREQTTYAVVLTERLTGPDGSPVRSPWDYVHHLRQTEALQPAVGALEKMGMGLNDIAYAWTFTTGDQTGDLVAARNGLLGKGPLKGLDNVAKEGVRKAHLMTDVVGANPVVLPIEALIGPMEDLGLFDEYLAEIILGNYVEFGDGIVGGEFLTTNLFGEPGQAQAAWPAVDDSDDYWQIDAHNGWFQARAERVAFTCVRPKDVPQPAPVVMFGHGYGSNRVEFLTFAWGIVRFGLAACSLDYPGHGVGIDPEFEDLARTYLNNAGVLPALDHLLDGRHRDLDNDGEKDSGGDQWSADAFHTRDMVRQGALDHAQFHDSLRACGSGTMELPDGSTTVSCDWDGDGTPDIGGPDVSYSVVGGSLGGINIGVAAAIMDDIDGFAPIVPGGGLLDVAFRTEIGGAVEAMHGRLMSPLILGYPTEDGRLQVVQMVNSVLDMVTLPIGVMDVPPPNSRIIVENLVTGEIKEGWIPADGAFRVGVAADAVSAYDKALLAGKPLDGTANQDLPYVIEDPTQAGDALKVTIQTESGDEIAVFDTWETDVTIQGVTYPAGSTLVAAAEGLGHERASPEARRVAFVFANILEPGDPIAYARAWTEEPFEELSGEPRNVLLMPTPGDPIVNINTGIALARAAGWMPDETDARYGMSTDQWLIEKRVVQGLEQYGPYVCDDGNPCLFDADDLDDGFDTNGAPSEAPLRMEVQTSSGASGMRLPYADPQGVHGYNEPSPDVPFQWVVYAFGTIGTYFSNGGSDIVDDVCMEDLSCSWIPQLPDDGGGGDGGDDSADSGGVR